MQLVLASSSPYRRELLARLGLPFAVEVPDVDESSLSGETPEDLVARLSEAKARAVATRLPDAVVIGSDQVAAAGQPLAAVLGKPGNRSAAVGQLRMLSGRQVSFFTGLCVIGSVAGIQLATEVTQVIQASDPEVTQVLFRRLTAREIAAYVDREQPYDCAASLRSEKLGIALVESIRGADPNALLGLPLIRLCGMLKRAGLNPLQ